MDAATPRATKDCESDATKVTTRKLKKRELDRRAQRLARERTKSRIRELESLVEQLQADTALSDLTATLARVTQQRDELQSVIRSINQNIQRVHQSPLTKPGDQPQEHSQAFNPSHDGQWTGDDRALPDVLPRLDSTTGDCATNVSIDDPQFMGDSWDAIPHNEFLCTEFPPTTMSQDLTSQASPKEQHYESSLSDDIIIPRAEWPCYCERDSHSNTWKAANTALGKATVLSPAQAAIEDFTSHDTPVRVILDGWDSVENAGKMSLSWRKLKEIDVACFSTCGDVERLGILRMMHLLLTSHGNPTQERCDKVPRWLWTRPSQTIPHSYAIDFFVWPGLRERFIFTQHRYCTNLFWELFRLSIRLEWPWALNDCFGADPETGRYVLSPAFEACLQEINTWRMTVDFFSQFPELSVDIPVSGSIAPSMPLTRGDRARRQHLAAEEQERTATGIRSAPRPNKAPAVSNHSTSSGRSLATEVFDEHQSLVGDGTLHHTSSHSVQTCPWPSV